MAKAAAADKKKGAKPVKKAAATNGKGKALSWYQG